jgi:hypothetical protein
MVKRRLDWAKECIGAYDVAHVTRGLVNTKVVKDLKERPKPGTKQKIGPATINRYVSVISGVLNWGCDEDLRDHNDKPALEAVPCFKYQNEKAARKVRDALDLADQETILVELSRNATCFEV